MCKWKTNDEIMSYSRCARLCPCQHITFQWVAAWPRCTCARMERTFTGSGPQLVSTRRLRKATLCSWMSFISLWELAPFIGYSTFSCIEYLCAWLGFYKDSFPLPVLPAMQTQTGLCVADTLQERVILNRKEGESSKCLNELLLSRMSRFRASHSATLAALTGSAITNTVKEEQSGTLSSAPNFPFCATHTLSKMFLVDCLNSFLSG